MEYALERWRSEDRDRHERGDWWRDQVSTIHRPMSFEVPNDYRGVLEQQRSDTYQLIRWWGDAETLSRNLRQIRTTPHDAYELLVPVTGVLTLRQDDEVSQVAPTHLAVASLDQPLDLRHDDAFSSIAFIIPRERLDTRLSRPGQQGVLLDVTSGLGRVVVDVIASVRAQGKALTGSQFDAICDRVVDLLALAYNAGATGISTDVGDSLVATIRRFVRENAHDPSLTGAVVAARLGWSLRNIQAQLQRVATTPSDLIREERLSLARLRLQDPAWTQQTITQVAFSSGFSDLSTFSNAYRREFGERPSDTRARSESGA